MRTSSDTPAAFPGAGAGRHAGAAGERARFSPRRLAQLGLAALVLSGGNAVFNPHRPAWENPAGVLQPGEITVEQARGTHAVVWIDARPAGEFAQGHIEGALPLNEDTWADSLPAVLAAWQPEHTIIVYCSSVHCQASQAVAERLRHDMPGASVWVLKGGWEAWQHSAR